MSKKYIEGFEKDLDESSERFLYCLNLHKENTYSLNRNVMEKCLNFMQDYPHQHKYMYDSLSLKKILTNSGLSSICECSYGISNYSIYG